MKKQEKELCNRSKAFENEQICLDLNSVMDYTVRSLLKNNPTTIFFYQGRLNLN